MVYLIPSLLSENAVETIPPYVMDRVRKCEVFFAENVRTARRFLKKMDASVIIDNFQWFEILKNENRLIEDFKACIREGKVIGIISEAGCPGVADPGQLLISCAQKMGARVVPLVGPSSLLLALMASGMNGQLFTFHGYLPIDGSQRTKKIKQLEEDSHKRNCTQLFIETPYRNEALLNDMLKHCKDETLLCIASEVTSENEWIKTKTIGEWKKEKIAIHKKPVIFLLGNSWSVDIR